MIITKLQQICLDAYDKMIGLDLKDLVVDGCIVKAPWGGEAAGRSPVDRGNRVRNVRCSWTATASRSAVSWWQRTARIHPRWPPRETLARFGVDLPEQITVHPDAGHDSCKTRELLATLGCDGIISTRGVPLQVSARRVTERTCPASSSWQGFFSFEVGDGGVGRAGIHSRLARNPQVVTHGQGTRDPRVAQHARYPDRDLNPD